jgi:hypothetical protein
MKNLRILAGFSICASLAMFAQEPKAAAPLAGREAVNPALWEVKVLEGSKLASLRDQYRQRGVVRAAEFEDRSPLPVWFRNYIRHFHPDTLPTQGRYQYPRVSVQLLEWLVAHPDLQVPPPRAAARGRAVAKAASVGTNINITNANERNSESFIAIDEANSQYVVAGSNNIGGTGRQKQFYSSDSGATWSSTELPLQSGTAFQSDPAVAFLTNGTVFAATLGVTVTNSVFVEVFKSTDHGATWSFVTTVSTGNNNDKELLVSDTHSTSPNKDNLYIAWDVGTGMRFSRSTDKGATWSAPTTLSTDSAIGAHLATGPSGELYVAWPDTTSRELRIRKSTDGGASFAVVKVIATTNDSYDIGIPSFCVRRALIYVSIGVDRSGGPRNGNVYASWTDRDGAAEPGCNGITSAASTNVYFSSSSDGGTTWSAPKIVHTNPASTDQFNQWMGVDPHDGSIHVAFYDTRDDTGRQKTNVYYAESQDGGASWTNETKVTTAQTDETTAGADPNGNQYGDYNGLAAFNGVARPSWTDRRTGNPGGNEQIYTTAVTQGPILINFCQLHPKACIVPVDLKPGIILVECLVRPCWVIDPLPKNCLVKFSCPGCPPDGLCPPWYQITLDGVDPAWTVGLRDPAGRSVALKSVKTSKGVVISFRPTKANFKDDKVGNYMLTFKLKPEGKTNQKYEIKTALVAADKPYGKP